MGIVVDDNHYVHAHTADGLVKKNKIGQRNINVSVPNPLYVRNPIGFKRLAVHADGYRWSI